MNKQDRRITELLELAAQGVRLPYSPRAICNVEDLGYVVDLETGGLVLNGANRPAGEMIDILRRLRRGG